MTARPMTEWFYSAPIDALAVRRGDPLGMRAIADEMAERLAPGLSNRTMDGRWISIICWAVGQGNCAWRALHGHAGDEAVTSRQAMAELYSWIRPLEVLWIARTVSMTKDAGQGRQLPGVQAARQWISLKEASERFGFAAQSYERYRFTGVYGGYRVLLRSLPNLTTNGDGWRLDKLGQKIAREVQERVRCPEYHIARKGPRLSPEDYWLRVFDWRNDKQPCLPTILAEPEKLPHREREYLKEALFSTGDADGVRRLHVLKAAAASSATSRADMFSDIAKTLGGGKPLAEIRLLSAFCELADAGVAAMNACWVAVSEGDRNGTGFVRKRDLLEQEEVGNALEFLLDAAKRWRKESSSSSPYAIADALADSVLAAGGKRQKQLLALENHHTTYGGGLRWLAIDGDVVKPLAPLRGGQTSEYRYRLGALCRLGVQCGLIGEMPAALRAGNDLDSEDEAA